MNWAAIAACESGGNWSASTGNGFYGGLQFTERTWLGYGGGRYAPSANLATPAQQIAVARQVLAGQGMAPGPCAEHGANTARRHLPALGSHQRGQAGDAEPVPPNLCDDSRRCAADHHPTDRQGYRSPGRE